MSNQANRAMPTDATRDLEASVLGGIILRNQLLAELETLETADFADAKCRIVFEAVRNLEAKQIPIDVVMLEHEIEKAGKLDAVGGIAFLGELALRVPTVDNTREYARQVQDRSRIRRIAIVASELLERAQAWDEPADELLGKALNDLAHLDRAKPDRARRIGDVVKSRVHELEKQWEARARGEVVWSGAPTGVKNLDSLIGGYPFGDVAIIAARPAMGKSALAMAAVDATTLAGFGAHVFSPEGGWRMYADRAISRSAKVSVQTLRAGTLATGQAANVSRAMREYSKRTNWMLDDRGGLSAAEIVRSVYRHKAELKTRLVVVDYLNILRRNPKLVTNENAALEEIMNTFAQAAPNDDIAWLLCCQLNRNVEERPDKRPVLADIRGSGSLEQVGRVIVSPYRGSHYSDTPKRHVDYDCDCSDDDFRRGVCSHALTEEQFKASAQVLVLKNNNGEQNTRALASWHGQTMEIS